MAGTGPAPKFDRVNRSQKPTRGEWSAATGIGWQHGGIPKPPPRLLAASRETWEVWMRSWVASHWEPMDLPGLRHTVGLYDLVQRGETRAASELRQMMDSYGITKKGQQDRRWLPPKAATDERATPIAAEDDLGPYAGLHVIN